MPVLDVLSLPDLDWQKSDVEEYFCRLRDQWLAERGPTSLTSRMILHPAYQQIIGMGPQALPLIFRELEQKPGHWFWALRAITGVDPIPAELRGDIREMAKCWLQWGRDRGYRW